ncbi:hypothetical protein J7413_07065 [Shimia sp. R10_1]|uniref:hypothetical protein n=1 Tax=Shimia sp. R10_1 TaxID=2821095 RepID=UPI001AD9E2CC|nr:hypothetical protein [Shimia sp. R10_1]MBO9473295.1 hypothetical protein [Shimia sp. R10_1]
MVTNNKVLTVSYGTFSCTLEGFEESFDTMKAIAEYFRDLAADDRYFGAEPPTPDAEMLARIAEKEIARRVSARMDQGTIVLSTNAPQPTVATPASAAAPAAAPVAPPVAQNDAPAAAPTTPEVASAPAPQPPLTTAPQADASTQATAQQTLAEDVAPAAITPSVTDSVLSAIANDTLDTAPAEDDLYIEDAIENVSDDTPIDLGAIAAVVSADEHAEEELSDTAVEEAVAEEIAETAEDTTAEDTVEEAPEEEALTVSAEDQDTAEAEDSAEELQDHSEEQAEETADTPATDTASDDAPLVLENVVEDSSDPFAEPATELSDWDAEEEEDSTAYEENSIAAKLERIRAVVSRSAEAPAEMEEVTAADPAEAEDQASERNIFDEADVAAPSEEEISPTADAEAGDTAQTEEAVANMIASEADLLADGEEYTADAAESTATTEDTAPLRARVVRMKKADFEEAVAAGLLEAEPVEDDADPQDAPASSLTPEDEAELLSELAQVEAELKQADAEPTESADDADLAEDAENLFAEDPTEAPTQAAAPAPERAVQTEADLSRLMAKADSEMQEPAGKGRRSAIAHLRAAVAATRAEKRNKSAASDADDTSAYRSDLASAVSPASDMADATQPAASPLKLVAAQRVDGAPASADSSGTEAAPTKRAPRRIPVRPRRISADQFDRDEAARAAAPVSSGNATLSGFTDYAKSVGATQLPESVEAAAAYLTYVEGMQRFTRPMLMRMAREVNIPQFTREEGLRSFGQLLREKKIEKLAGGRFTATQAINFQPRDREAG